jgi:CRP-like cAMP-binding protein
MLPARRVNSLLSTMSPAGRSGLFKLLKPAVLNRGDVLFEAQTTIRHVYFPVDCLVSLLAPINGHAPMEVAMVGSEGMVGVPFAPGLCRSRVRAVVQAAGNVLFMSASAFRLELQRQPSLRRGFDRFIHSLIAQLTQTAACNAFHPIEARCARSLLMARDRVQGDELDLTHELLAQMLGVRRVGVTVAAGNLQRRGVIAYSRGRIVILDAERLAEAACECYAVIKEAYEHGRTLESRLITPSAA